MIATEIEARCKYDGRPIVRVPGRRPREFCNDVCRQRYHRQHQQGKHEQPTLEQQNLQAALEKLSSAGDRIQKLESQVQVQRSRIGELTEENRSLRMQIESIQLADERFRNDTQMRAFPAWLEKHARYYAESPFGQRFLANRRERLLPPSASRSHYESVIRHTLHYSEEDLEMFREAWREMLKTQF